MKKIILSTVIIASLLMMVVYFNTPKEPIGWSEYVVCDGETVCDIAIYITPEGEDYRYTQYCITEKNNIKNAMIYPGQTILVPDYE